MQASRSQRPLNCALGLYLVMGIGPARAGDALKTAELALQGGVTMLQLREKDAPLKQTLEVGARLRELCRAYGVPFVVNDRLDVALLLEADGLHVGQNDLPCSAARKLMPSGTFVGVSASSFEEAEEAVRSGADYLGVGTVYATATKQDAGEPTGPGLIARIRAAYNIPIVGIGGINLDNAAEVLNAGADGIAVVSAITGSTAPKEAAASLKKTVEALRFVNKNKSP